MVAQLELDWATRKVVTKWEEPPESERRGLNKGGTWNADPRQSLDKTWMVI